MVILPGSLKFTHSMDPNDTDPLVEKSTIKTGRKVQPYSGKIRKGNVRQSNTKSGKVRPRQGQITTGQLK